MENKKIKNASACLYQGIEFKSKIELTTYTELIKAGFSPNYEPIKFILWEGFKPTIPFYVHKMTSKDLLKNNTKLIDTTYTPDFYVKYNDIDIFIEVKGFVNDVYPYKCKMFRKYLEEHYPNKNCMFFEIRTKKDIIKLIQIIKDYDSSRKNN